LSVGQVPNEIVQFVRAIDEIGVINDLAKNEGVFLGSHYAISRNANWRNVQATPKRRSDAPRRPSNSQPIADAPAQSMIVANYTS